MNLLALSLYHTDPGTGRVVLHAMPVMLGVLCCLAIAYRYYSAFLAAKVAALDDTRVTPAHRFNDGQNYHPTNRWVLFGHHFAAISGAGPLIGPVLAIQYGYAPGLLWLVVGVCLAGAVQDMLVLAASVRHDGKSLAEIARAQLGRGAAAVASVAILFIVIIALAGLGFVVVKALGGEEVKLPKGTVIVMPDAADWPPGPPRVVEESATHVLLEFPQGCQIQYAHDRPKSLRPESFRVRVPSGLYHRDARASLEALDRGEDAFIGYLADKTGEHGRESVYVLPAGCSQAVPGSSWGTFTIACTIPIALFTGLWMYRVRPGRVVEASVIGGALTLAAVVAGNWVPGSPLERVFSLSRDETIVALGAYGFVAAVLPVWLLLGPRDYLSSFLKIGTIGLLVVGVCVANPPLNAPVLNEVFINGGPTFPGAIFPFVFICIMCGAISGFHSLVSSGTTPKMVEKESHVRRIGYGAMLMEGLVGVVALIAAASLPSGLYYDINVAIDRAQDPVLQKQLAEVKEKYGSDPLHEANVDSPQHLDLGRVEEKVGGESLRGRTGGAVTLAVGMSVVFEDAFRTVGVTAEWLLKYWYHFAIMFEALFILTTIDAGTRIARFLFQETVGRVYAPFGRPDWLLGALVTSALVTVGWCYLVWGGSILTIWSMFGIANQVLAVLALALVTTWLVNNGRGRYAPVTVLPMLFVISTTLTAAAKMVTGPFYADMQAGLVKGYLNAGLTVFVVACVLTVVVWAAARWLSVWLAPR
ncbi:MAG: carbon starvation protein A [Gemmataceae bacterium]|nr:carbon starvation protein A [Gemmataceae bacterium]